MQYNEPMPHLQAVDGLTTSEAEAMHMPLGRNVDQWNAYFADRSLADLINSLQAYNRIQCGVDRRYIQSERDRYNWYHTLRNLIISELVYRLGPDVWHWAGRIETPDARAVKV